MTQLASNVAGSEPADRVLEAAKQTLEAPTAPSGPR